MISVGHNPGQASEVMMNSDVGLVTVALSKEILPRAIDLVSEEEKVGDALENTLSVVCL
jgi:hypothetical protein